MGECELHLCWCCVTTVSKGLVARRGSVDRVPRYSDMVHDLKNAAGIVCSSCWSDPNDENW